ncbi:hypothetical protein O0L34_g15415 [Tuta absoluta]|nr:hypothetical protein O0L34_g15415 [Tuta absoluta]
MNNEKSKNVSNVDSKHGDPVAAHLRNASLRGINKHNNAASTQELEMLKEENNTAVHFLSPEQLEVIFKTDIKNGLEESHAAQILARDGPNQLKKLKGTSYWKVFRHNLFGWFQCVLWIGAALNFIAYFASPKSSGHSRDEYLYLGIVIVCTVVGTGLFGFYHEAKNVAVMKGFDNMVPPAAFVIRDGIKKEIPNRDLVCGDIVEMHGGQTVPADVRILECENFKTDMASLTGESLPISHRPFYTHANPLESKNMCYFTCPITEGTARGIVVDTGEFTQIGKIAGLVTGLQKVQTPLNKEITHFIKIICAVAFVLGISFFIMVIIVQKNWLSALMYMLGIILANVPEGLLVTLTVCMTLSAKELKKKNCLAKTLQAVETLGSTSCICSDKTGTLTINQMTVSHLFSDFAIIDKNDHSLVADPIYSQLCIAACLNIKATFTHETKDLPIEKRKIFGDASEAAILRYMEANRDATKTQIDNPRVAMIPFSSVYKYQVTIHVMHGKDQYYLTMKGGPEIVLEHCTTVFASSEINEMSVQVVKQLKENFIKMANMGERVIGYGDLWLSKSKFPKGFQFDTQNINFPLEGLRFLGAISMIDPARPEVPESIAICREAGIKVTMVTGDHPVTALAISRKIGTITHPTAYDYAFEHHIDVLDVPLVIRKKFLAAVITGYDLRKMTDYELRKCLTKYEEITFARTSPQQKLFIVENYQKLNYVVAVTGDGVNDSPALKKADIGIAMGITGTEVSKQAADMILLDDNFASIILGVEEGRRIFDNLKKTIAYTLTSNSPEMLPFVLYALLGMPLPMSLILILAINVGTDLLPAMSLAYENKESDIMKLPPRKPTDHLVTGVLIFMAYFQVGLIQFFAAMYSYYTVYAVEGFFPGSLFYIRESWENKKSTVVDSFGNSWTYPARKVLEQKAQTAYFVSVCFAQISDVIICKTRRLSLLKQGMKNWMLNFSILVDLLAASLLTYVPIFNKIFGTQPLEPYAFFLSLPFFVLMIILDEIRRYLIRNNWSKWVERETYY